MSAVIVLVALAVYLVFYFVYGKSIQRNLLRSHEAPEAPASLSPASARWRRPAPR